MNRAPAFQFYPDKWQSHTRRLSDSSYRVFHELICWMWQHSPDHCSIHASPEAVACALAMPLTTVEPALNEINNPHSPLLKKDGGRWVCNGLKKEAEKQADWRRKSSIAGKASAAKRNKPTTVQPPFNAGSVLVQPKSNSPSPSPSPSPSLKDIPPVGGEHGAFIKTWTENYESFFKRKYAFTPRDAKATKEILSIGIPRIDVLEIATRAWHRQRVDSTAWGCGQGVTIHGFAANLNKIQAELDRPTQPRQGVQPGAFDPSRPGDLSKLTEEQRRQATAFVCS